MFLGFAPIPPVSSIPVQPMPQQQPLFQVKSCIFNNNFKNNIIIWVRVNQRLYFPLSAMDFLLLAWYQQAGRWQKAVESGKYVDISGKWSRYFTLTLIIFCDCLFQRDTPIIVYYFQASLSLLSKGSTFCSGRL